MMFYDAEFAKINAKYHEERLVRSAQDWRADFDFLGNVWKNATQGIRAQFHRSVDPSKPSTIGKVQTNLG